MMERQISSNEVARGAAWASTVVLYAIGAGVMIDGHWLIAIFIAELACGMSAYAAVRHLRCYAANICRKIDDAALERDIARVSAFPAQAGRPVRH